MLVLTRRIDEKIVLPELGVTIEVVSIKGNSVRLGIEAPPEIRIARAETITKPIAYRQPTEQTDSAVTRACVQESNSQYHYGRGKNHPDPTISPATAV